MDAIPPDRHLQLPIIYAEVEDVLRVAYAESVRPCRQHEEICTLIKKCKVHSTIRDVCPSVWKCLGRWCQTTDYDPPDLKHMIDVTNRCHNNEVKFCTKNSQSHNVLISNEQINELSTLYTDKYKADCLKDKLKASWKGKVFQINNLWWHSTICLYNCPIHGFSAVPTTQVLSILDSFQRRWSCAIYFVVCDSVHKYSFSSYNRFKEIDKMLIYLRDSTGQRFFKLLKSMHSLATGWVISQESDLAHKELLNNILEDLKLNLPEMFDTDLVNLLLPSLNSSQDEFWTLELSGIAKAYGHPYINIDVGIKTLREYACKVKEYSEEPSEVAQCMFAYQFCKYYYRRHRKWPNLELKVGCSDIIQNHFTNNTWPRGSEARKLKMSDWSSVEFKKNFEFDYTPDMFEILSDKALAPTRQNWSQNYCACGFQLHHGVRKPRIGEYDETRVLIRYLKSSPDDGYQYINAINIGLKFKSEDISIMCFKEGEESDSGRLFAKLTWFFRLFNTLLEKATVPVLRYFPCQSMTISELDLMKRINLMSRGTAKYAEVCVFFILDIVKFNMQFRIWMINSIMKHLDDNYGFNNVYQDCHAAFDRSVILTNIRTRPPKPSQGDDPLPGAYCHYFQSGGLEGQKQKPWTLAIQMWLLSFATENRYCIHLLGQGDNQVIMWRPTHKHCLDLRSESDSFIRKLKVYLDKINMPLKPEETWFSKRLLQYNKQSYILGVQVPNGVKHALKISPDSNELLDTLDNRIASIATMAEATARLDSTPYPAHWMYCFETILLSYREKLLGNTDLMSYHVVPYWNRSIGGFPGTFLICMTQRGLHDRLTIQLCLCKFLKTQDTESLFLLAKLSPLIFHKTPQYNLLLVDPSALNLISGCNIDSYVRECVRESIKNVATNESVVSLWDQSSTIESNELVSALVTMRPFHGRLAAEIFRCSDAGILLMLCSLFEKTRTLMGLTAKNQKGFLKEVRKRENSWRKLIKSNWDRNQKYTSSRLLEAISQPCSTDAAKQLRFESWQIEIEGVTVPCPVEQLHVSEWDDSNVNKEKSIMISTSKLFREWGYEMWRHAGPFSPYLGSSTQEKLRRPQASPVHITTKIKAARRLGTLKSWMQKWSDGTGEQLLSILLSEKGLAIEELSPQVIAGNIYHRLHTANESMNSLINHVSSPNTHFSIATSQMKHYSSGGDDYTIFFQSLFLYAMWFSWNVIGRCGNRKRQYAFEIICEGCTRKLPSEKIVIHSMVKLNRDEDPSLQSIEIEDVYPQGDKHLAIWVASQFVGAALGYDSDYHLDDYLPALVEGDISMSVVTIPLFRQSHPETILSNICIRYPEVMRWVEYLSGINNMIPLTPPSLISLTTYIMKSGMLPIYSKYLSISPSHAGSYNPASLSQDILFYLGGFIKKFLTRGNNFLVLKDEEKSKPLKSIVKKYNDMFQTKSKLEGTVSEDHIMARLMLIKFNSPTFLKCPSKFVMKGLWVGDSSHDKPVVDKTLKLIQLPWPLYHLSRGCGRVSSAASKYIQILSNPDVSPNFSPDVIICTAEGCGGVLSTLMHLYPSAHGVFNTLLEDDHFSLIEPTLFTPSALLGCMLSTRCPDLEKTVTGDTDLSSKEVGLKLSNIIINRDYHTGIITMDAELICPRINYKGIFNNIKSIFKLLNKSIVILKVFHDEELDVELENFLREINTRWMLLKPSSSNRNNKELFVVLGDIQVESPNLSYMQAKNAMISLGSSSRVNIMELVEIGKSLSNSHPCCNISERDLFEITGMSGKTIQPKLLLSRILGILSCRWEEIEENSILTHILRVKNREQVVLNRVIPLIILYEMWMLKVQDLSKFVDKLNQYKVHLVFNYPYGWPNKDGFSLILRKATDESIVNQLGQSFKKLVRAYLSLPPIHKGYKDEGSFFRNYNVI